MNPLLASAPRADGTTMRAPMWRGRGQERVKSKYDSLSGSNSSGRFPERLK